MKTKNTISYKVGKILGRHRAFTLVELIIVITILAILATIAFISFQWFTKDARDADKTTTLANMQKALELHVTKADTYPEPENVYWSWYVTVDWVNIELTRVWYIWDSIARMLNISKTPIDPLTSKPYVYGVSGNNRDYQIASTLEWSRARVLWSYNYPLVLNWHVFSLPSLIFNWTGWDLTVEAYAKFVIDKWLNIPYALKWWDVNAINTQTTAQVLWQIVWNENVTLTWVTLPTKYNWSTSSSDIATTIFWENTPEKIDQLWMAVFTPATYLTEVKDSSGWSDEWDSEPTWPTLTWNNWTNIWSVWTYDNNWTSETVFYAWVYQWRTLWVAWTENIFLQWKTSNTPTSDASNATDGRENTGTFNSDHPASNYCQNLNWAWYTDWYLPAANNDNATTTSCSTQSWEMQFLYCQHKWTGSQALLGFASKNYWSSTEETLSGARRLYFGNGSWDYYIKDITNRFRCVRVAD